MLVETFTLQHVSLQWLLHLLLFITIPYLFFCLFPFFLIHCHLSQGFLQTSESPQNSGGKLVRGHSSFERERELQGGKGGCHTTDRGKKTKIRWKRGEKQEKEWLVIVLCAKVHNRRLTVSQQTSSVWCLREWAHTNNMRSRKESVAYSEFHCKILRCHGSVDFLFLDDFQVLTMLQTFPLGWWSYSL